LLYYDPLKKVTADVKDLALSLEYPKLVSSPGRAFFPNESHMNRLIAYINDSLEELRHVRWPTRQQAVRFSAVVIVFVLICGAFFGFMDFALSELVKTVLDFAA
jgi:preprotein translocase subunit SecE